MNVYPMKCRIRNDAGTTRVDVYDDVGGDPFWGGGISASDVAGQLAGISGPLDVHINSGGGDVFQGLAIGEAIRSHKGRVTTIVDGIAASIASVIAQAGQQRVMAPGAMLMIHDAFGTCLGNAAEMSKMADTLDKVSGNIAAVYASRAGRSADYWRGQMQSETWYTAEEAVEAGLADRVGDDTAQLPPGLDLAAFTAVPGRIAARLRTMPQAAAAPHAPMTGTHSHPHPAFGSQGGDSTHDHEHSHDGDASHSHSHATAADHAPKLSGAMHGDHERVDPDGDGDCDACPEGDTDHDYWTPGGEQIKPLPVPTEGMTGALTAAEIAALRALITGTTTSQYWNAKYKQEDRDRMAKSGEAMADGSYPIADEEDLSNAIHAVGRGGADHDSIRKHIIKRAKALGKSDAIPDNWNADGSLEDDSGSSNHMDPESFRAALKGAFV